VAGTFAAAPIGFAAANNPRRANQSPTPLSYAAFAEQINTPFRVAGPSGEVVELRLKKVRLAPRSTSAPGRRPPLDANNERFSLILTGPDTSPLAAAIHSFEHSELGRFEMYCGEIGLRSSNCIRYEVVLNQPAPITYPR
jgi:hypothetical protein